MVLAVSFVGRPERGLPCVDSRRYHLFSDEKTFQLFGHPHNRYIWAPEASDVPAQASVKHPPKLHVWAGMSYNGKTELYMFKGNMDAEFYEGILKERLLPDAARMFGGRPWVFQQDGDPKHNSARVQAWLRDNVRFLAKGDWPANSPDLNPMENLWAYLQQRVTPGNRGLWQDSSKSFSRSGRPSRSRSCNVL